LAQRPVASEPFYYPLKTLPLLSFNFAPNGDGYFFDNFLALTVEWFLLFIGVQGYERLTHK